MALFALFCRFYERTPFSTLSTDLHPTQHNVTGDRNMFTVNMYCSRMAARSIRVGLVIDCTALDLEEFEPLPEAPTPVATIGNKKKASRFKPATNKLDRRVRYFHNPSEWDDYDVEYHRLMPPKVAKPSLSDIADGTDGDNDDKTNDTKNEPLAPQVIPEFIQIVTKFIQKSRSATNNNTSTTHISLFDSRGGLGAASYLAAAYMCHSMKAPVHAAFEAVKEGSPAQPLPSDVDRKWGLCDVRLVKDLQERYKGRKEIVIEGGVPKWWWALEDEEEEEEDDAEDGKQSANEEGGGETTKESSVKRKRSEGETIIIPSCESTTSEIEEEDTSKRLRTNEDMPPPNNTSTMFPVLPKEVLEPVAKDSPKWTRAVTVLAQLTQSPQSVTYNTTLLEKLPLKPEVDASSLVSSDASEGNGSNNLLQLIKCNQEGYKVTWLSTKGRRGLLLILTEAVFFIEQGSSSVSVSIVTNIMFPSPKDLQKQQHRTLLDVVLVHDVEKNNKCHRFYALDILCIEGGMVWHKPFDQRWRYLSDGVLIPRKKDEASQQHSTHVYAKEAIKIRAKEYFPIRKLGYVMKDVCAGVGHDAEGVRIVPTGAYGIGGSNSNNGGSEEEKTVVWKRGGNFDEKQLISMLS
eukprot:scaffold193_cov203-Alexandrium_tamarense.AAC.3